MNIDGHDIRPVLHASTLTLAELDAWLSRRSLQLELRSGAPNTFTTRQPRVVMATLRRVDRGVLSIVASVSGRTVSLAVANAVAFWEREREGFGVPDTFDADGEEV